MKIKDAPVAQGIEHRIPNPGVVRSNRAGGTNNIKDLHAENAVSPFLFCDYRFTNHRAICGLSTTSARATSCMIIKGQTEAKISIRVISGGATDFR